MQGQKNRIVIVGGGVIGLSIAYHLAHLGLKEVLLLERHQLTSGSSWHAAGIVGPLRASMNLTLLAKYAIDLFCRLERETGQATGYQQTGGLWLAQRQARLTELKRIKAMGDRSNLDCRMLDPAEIREKMPMLNIDGLVGGLWVEQDGQVNPVDLCMAYARAARTMGVKILENTAVSDIETCSGVVDAVVLEDGSRIECNKLVIAAGAWSRQLGAMAAVDIPLVCGEHIYVVTDPVEGLSSPCPIVRDLDAGIYFKGDAGKLVLGTFEHNPRLWRPSGDDAAFLMFDQDWDHAQPMLEAGIKRLPLIANQGITHFMNGPESFTPDSRQIMGEAPACRNLFVAAGFNSIGIMSSAGVGKVMAQWIRDNAAPIDLWEVDIARFDPLQCNDDYLGQRLAESVHNQFDMHWPYKQFKSGRNLRRSAWHEQLLARAAVFGAPGGWERPLWFASDDSENSLKYSYGAQSWWPMARREALHCQRHVSLFELSPFGKFEVCGKNALKYLQRLCCSNIDIAEDRVQYSLMLNTRGGIEAEITVTRMASDKFRIISGAATRFKDYHWLIRHGADYSDLIIRDVSEDYAVLGVMGPGSRALMEKLADTDFGDAKFPFSSARCIRIGNCELLALRLSFVGELGWELYIPHDQAKHVFDTIAIAGAAHNLGYAGHFALDSCRLEKGFHHWGHDIGNEDSPFEAGLGFSVSFDKQEEFIGKLALLEQKKLGWRKQLQLCEVLAEEVLILKDEPIYSSNRIVGHCTSGGLGFRTGKALCFVMFYEKDSVTGLALEIEIAGERHQLKILYKAPYQAAVK